MPWSGCEAHLVWQQWAQMSARRVSAAALCALRSAPASSWNPDWTEGVTLSAELSVWCCTIVPPAAGRRGRNSKLFDAAELRRLFQRFYRIWWRIFQWLQYDFRRGETTAWSKVETERSPLKRASLIVWMIISKWMVSMATTYTYVNV